MTCSERSRSEYVISRHALPLQDVIFDGSRCLQRVGLIAGRRFVRLRTGGGQQRVGTCPGATDDGIRRFISPGDLIVKRSIGAVAFEPQAFVGLFALRTRKQRICHRPPGDSFVSFGSTLVGTVNDASHACPSDGVMQASSLMRVEARRRRRGRSEGGRAWRHARELKLNDVVARGARLAEGKGGQPSS